MAKVQVAKEYPICAIGIHIFTLVGTEVVRVKSTFSKEKDGKVDKIRWDFVSNQCDDDGEAYHYQPLTGFIYGDSRASLTQIIDMLVPGISASEAVNLDTDDLNGYKYEGLIRHTKVEDKMYASAVYLTPVGATYMEAAQIAADKKTEYVEEQKATHTAKKRKPATPPTAKDLGLDDNAG